VTPQELLDSCLERIAVWNAGERYADEPTMALTLQRAKPPTGDHVRLYGRSGPRGRLATCRPRGDGWMVVAYFPAAAVARDIAKGLGVEVDLRVEPKIKRIDVPTERREHRS
jgi:hypothetical protein